MRQSTTFRHDPVWNLLNEVERVFDNTRNTPPTKLTFQPTSDVFETSEAYLLSVDLPGVTDKEIKIEVQPGRLTVSGERKRAPHRSERHHGLFERSFALPQDVRTDEIQARFENGVLEIWLPKIAVAQARSIEVNREKGGLFSHALNAVNPTQEQH